MNPKRDSFALYVLSLWGGCLLGVIAFFAATTTVGFVAELLIGNKPLDFHIVQILNLFAFFVAAVAGAYVCANSSGEARLVACAFLGIAGSLFYFIFGVSFSDAPDWVSFVRGLLCLLGTAIGYVLGMRKPFADRLAARVRLN